MGIKTIQFIAGVETFTSARWSRESITSRTAPHSPKQTVHTSVVREMIQMYEVTNSQILKKILSTSHSQCKLHSPSNHAVQRFHLAHSFIMHTTLIVCLTKAHFCCSFYCFILRMLYFFNCLLVAKSYFCVKKSVK